MTKRAHIRQISETAYEAQRPQPGLGTSDCSFGNRPDRRREHDLRETITEYRKMAARAQIDAAQCKDQVARERYLALVKALTELGDTLQGRAS
jgi:hypothetical protein